MGNNGGLMLLLWHSDVAVHIISYSTLHIDMVVEIITSPTLLNIVFFRVLSFSVSLNILKKCLLARGFHTLIKNDLFFSLIDVGSHNPPSFELSVLADTRFLFPIDVRSHNSSSFGTRHPRRHSFICSINVGFSDGLVTKKKKKKLTKIIL